MKRHIALTMALALMVFACLTVAHGRASAQEASFHPLTFALSTAAAKKIITDAKGSEAWSPPGLISGFQDGDDKLLCILTVDPGADVCGSVSSEENAQKSYVVVISNATASSLCDELRMLSGIGGRRCASFYGKAGMLEDGSTPAVSSVTKYQIEPVDAGMFPHPQIKEAPFAKDTELRPH